MRSPLSSTEPLTFSPGLLRNVPSAHQRVWEGWGAFHLPLVRYYDRTGRCKACCATGRANLCVKLVNIPSLVRHWTALNLVTPSHTPQPIWVFMLCDIPSPRDFPKHQKDSLAKRGVDLPADLFLSPILKHFRAKSGKTM